MWKAKVLKRHCVSRKIPGPVKRLFRPVRNLYRKKDSAELSFWRSRYRIEGGRFNNSHYQEILLAMANEPDQTFLEGKVVADFGCGPRGSLVWADAASIRIGIDVLADRYADEFTGDLTSHNMLYVKSTEKVIPLPTGLVDVMFTLNAMDHVEDFPLMCREILRVLRPGGLLVGSFNLGEPPTPEEPQQLDEAAINRHLLDRLEVESYRVGRRGATGDTYGPLLRGEETEYHPGEEGHLWLRARKPTDT